MSVLDMLEKEFVNRNLVEGNTPDLVKAIADSMYSTNIPYRMKLAIAYSELILFFSQFRINIQHWNGSIIPINALTFCIAKSGAAKDSSVNACRKCFKSGYEYIDNHRKSIAIEKAKEKAKEEGEEEPEAFRCYKKYYKIPNPLFVSVPTPEGFIQHLADLKEDSMGSGYVLISELGAEMVSNVNFGDICKLISELYDEGSKNAKVIKDKEKQNKAIVNFPVSAMCLGSPSNILYDESIKKKFKMEFTSKLARRSFFIFANEDLVTKDDLSIQDLIQKDMENENKALEARECVDRYIKDIVKDLTASDAPKTLKVSKEVRELFSFYKRYNEVESSIVSERLPITKLSRAHLQWKAFKLSGALALADVSDTIKVEHYKAGIEFCEMIADDIHNFELELVKEPYELFVSFTHQYEVDGYYQISLHELRKAGFISARGLSLTSMKELVKLANSYDKTGLYTLNEKTSEIVYNRSDNNQDILVSYLKCTGTKEQRAKKCASGFQCEEIKFSQLKELLEGDFCYTCFKFANGIRGKDNIVSATKWIILDIDDSEITDEEAHLLLEGINHYVVRTSNKDVAIRYRILIELNREVDIPDYYWVSFINLIAHDLGFKNDKKTKSQIWFSYSDRNILSELDSSPLDVEPYINKMKEYSLSADKFVVPEKRKYTVNEANNLLSNPLDTFAYAYQAPDGEGRRRLIWAIKYARDIGCTKKYAKELIYNISQKYWVKHLPEKDLDIMYRQIDRWTGFKTE